MSYELRVWDPTRHAPLPTTADEALDMLDQLAETSDTRNSTLEKFGISLVQRYEDQPSDGQDRGGPEVFWSTNPREGTAACRTAVYQLSFPSDECTMQVMFAVEAAAEHGLVVVEDETGVCFLPDGTILPDDSRQMWTEIFAEVKDPTKKKPDSRTLLQKVAGELFDAIGQGNKRVY